MEEFRDEILDVIKDASFGGSPILTLKGMHENDFVSQDEDDLKSFLRVLEKRKIGWKNGYKATEDDLMSTLTLMYGLDKDFC